MPQYRIISIFDPTGKVNLEEEFKRARKIDNYTLPKVSKFSGLQAAVITGKSYTYTAITSCREGLCSVLTLVFGIGRIFYDTNALFTKIYIENTPVNYVDLRSIGKILEAVVGTSSTEHLICKREDGDFILELLSSAYKLSPLLISTILLILRDSALYASIMDTKKELSSYSVQDRYLNDMYLKHIIVLGIIKNVLRVFKMSNDEGNGFEIASDGSDAVSKFMVALFIVIRMFRGTIPLDGYVGPVDFVNQSDKKIALQQVASIIKSAKSSNSNIFLEDEKKLLKNFMKRFIEIYVNAEDFEERFWEELKSGF